MLCGKYDINEQFIALKWEDTKLNACSIVIGDIAQLLKDQSPLLNEFRNGLPDRVGSDHEIHFWSDILVSEIQKHVRFPRVFPLSENKSVAISDVGKAESGRWDLTLTFRRKFFVWEVH